MSREIKFRAWNGAEMVNHSLLWLTMNGTLYVDRGETGDKLLKYPLMQYTGLKDKNGVEIYEGDILRLYDDSIAKVEWDMGEFIVSPFFDDGLYLVYNTSVVIGNIYENSGLLK